MELDLVWGELRRAETKSLWFIFSEGRKKTMEEFKKKN